MAAVGALWFAQDGLALMEYALDMRSQGCTYQTRNALVRAAIQLN